MELFEFVFRLRSYMCALLERVIWDPKTKGKLFELSILPKETKVMAVLAKLLLRLNKSRTFICQIKFFSNFDF